MAKKLTPADEPGVFVYVGPNVHGLLQTGTIFTGTRTDVMSRFDAAAEKYPEIRTLIVRDKDLSEARRKIKAGGNLLANAYAAMLNKKEE